jgi:hypothetical protein
MCLWIGSLPNSTEYAFMFSKLFKRKTESPADHIAQSPVERFDLFPVGTGPLVIPDWDRVEASLADRLKQENPHALWSKVALCWLEDLRQALGSDSYAVQASENFILLSATSARERVVFLEYAEKTQKRILRLLEGIAAQSGTGKSCVIAFASEDEYYEYVSNYYPEEGEYAMSGGMYINAGYGHFVSVMGGMHVIEPMIAHELTHLHLAHLPIPAWLNEGLAVNTEYMLSPPPGQLYTPQELKAMHLKFWNAQTIQEFWSGKSYQRPDEGNLLSYDLGRQITALISSDKAKFVAFANEAHLSDAGDAAARAKLGIRLAEPVAFLLGEGDWSPNPTLWNASPERGGFRQRA